MSAPVITIQQYSDLSGSVITPPLPKLSPRGQRSIVFSFVSDTAYANFECRITKVGDDYGVGIGKLIASYGSTPADTRRSVVVYCSHLTAGDGTYRIGLYIKTEDGVWSEYE